VAKTEDRGKTRKRLLDAACEIFARDGFREAKVADICRLANANGASVNYYFRNKACLYAETWKYVFEQFEEPAFSDFAKGSPHEMLGEYIHLLMQNFTSKGGTAYFSRLYLMELANPTGLVQDNWREFIEPRRQTIHRIIREIMGAGADDQKVLFCELSIVNQCRTLLTVNHSDLEYLLDHPLTRDFIKRLADHITEFSLAGIKAMGRNTF